jgi:hypothetical protein
VGRAGRLPAGSRRDDAPGHPGRRLNRGRNSRSGRDHDTASRTGYASSSSSSSWTAARA